MKKIMKRMGSLLLALVLVAGMMPHFAVEAEAEGGLTATSGLYTVTLIFLNCGENYQLETISSITIDSLTVTGGKINVAINAINGTGNTVYLTFAFDNMLCTKALDVTNWDTSSEYIAKLNIKRAAQTSHTGGNCTIEKPCTVCGTSYIDPDAHNYSWHNEEVDGVWKHWQVCANNSAHKANEGICSGGTPTCTDKAVCGTCGREYGEPLGHSLSYSYKPAEKTIIQTCGNDSCDHTAYAYVNFDGMDFTYTGERIKPNDFGYDEKWSGGKLAVAPIDVFPKNVGQAKVGLSVEGVGVLNGLIISFDIVPAPLTVTADNKTITYGDAAPPLTHSITGFVNGETAKTALSGMSDIKLVTSYEQGKNAGDYEIAFVENSKVQTYGNYKFTYVPGKVSVGKVTPTADMFQVVLPANAVYTGNDSYSATVTSKNDGLGAFAVKYNGKTEAPSAAGTYKVTVDVEASTNYAAITDLELGEFEIAKATPNFAAPIPIRGLKYDGTAQNLITADESEHGIFKFALVTGAGSVDPADDTLSTSIPQGLEAGKYLVYWKLFGDSNHADVSGKVPVTIAKIAPTYEEPVANTDLIYNGEDQTLLAVPTSGFAGCTLEFALGQDDKTAPTTGWSDTVPTGKDAKDYVVWWKVVGDKNHNDVAPAAIPVTIAPKSISGIADISSPTLTWNGKEQTASLSAFTLYETEAKQDGLALTADDYTLTGNKATNVGIHEMTVTGKGNFTGTRKVPFLVRPDAALLNGIEENNVTSANKETIDKAKAMVDNAVATNLPDDMQKVLTDTEAKAEKLEAALNEALAAKATDEVKAGQAITADKAKVSDKKALEDAKADLEAALNTYKDNYTTEQKFDINAEISRIEAILADINNADVADVIEDIEDLPKSVEPDDEKSEDRIDAAQEAYDKLTASQKKIVDNSTSGKLAKLQAELLDIDVVSISHTKWYRTSKKDLTIKFNGPYNKFDYLLFNDKELDPKHYTAKEGSTIITLKSSFLDTLTTRKENTVVAVYEIDGKEVKSEAASFTAYKYASNAATGDLFNPMLWAGIGGFSILALAVLLYLMKKKK